MNMDKLIYFAELYQVENKRLNELVAICDRFEYLKYSTANPYAFSEQGVLYDGQVYDAYIFAADLIRRAKKPLIIDEKEIYHIGALMKDLGKNGSPSPSLNPGLSKCSKNLEEPTDEHES